MIIKPACLGKGFLITKKVMAFLAITLNIINIFLTLPKHAPRAFASLFGEYFLDGLLLVEKFRVRSVNLSS